MNFCQIVIAAALVAGSCSAWAAGNTVESYGCTVVERQSGGIMLESDIEVQVDRSGTSPSYALVSSVVEPGVRVDPSHSYLIQFAKADFLARDIGKAVLIWNDVSVGICK